MHKLIKQNSRIKLLIFLKLREEDCRNYKIKIKNRKMISKISFLQNMKRNKISWTLLPRIWQKNNKNSNKILFGIKKSKIPLKLIIMSPESMKLKCPFGILEKRKQKLRNNLI
jgi:hypothetical protein